jgi:hypothetical protein
MKSTFKAFLAIMLFAAVSSSAQSLSHDKQRLKTRVDKDAQTPVEETKPEEPKLFNQFAAGFGALFNGSNGGTSLDLSSFTVKYFLILGTKKDTVTVTQDGNATRFEREKYKGLDIFLINRTSINIDSIKAFASDYITSLQASPFTFRLAYEGFLTRNKEQTSNQLVPIIKYRFSGDARGIPFTKDSVLNVGGSINGYFSLLAKLRAIQVLSNGTIQDKGSFYFEPSIGFAVGNGDMMSKVFKDGSKKALLSSELRFGFISETKRVQDWGFLFRYTWENIIGPKFRVSFNVSPSF